MIYLLYGSDAKGARNKARQLINSLKEKKPNASFFRLHSENWQKTLFQEYIVSQGLFENKFIVFLDNLLAREDSKEDILSNLEKVSNSDNIFIFLDGVLAKPILKAFNKLAKIQEFILAKKLPKEEFNIFAFSDSFGARNKKNSWINYNKAKLQGAEAEQIHGILFWTVKNMILARESSKENSGLNGFVYSKAKKYALNYSGDELNNFASKLVDIYHDARVGKIELDIALEKFVLSI